MNLVKTTSNTWSRTATKPLSVNEAWFGRKVKSTKYRAYENLLFAQLPQHLVIPLEDPLKFKIMVFYSSTLSDVDNCLKPFIDILQKMYGFNDSHIYEIHIKKYLVPKGEEEILFNIEIMDKKCTEKLSALSSQQLKAKYLTI